MIAEEQSGTGLLYSQDPSPVTHPGNRNIFLMLKYFLDAEIFSINYLIKRNVHVLAKIFVIE